MISGSPITVANKIMSGSVTNTKFMWCSSACGTPVAQVTNGYLIIKSRHHGQHHMSAFSVQPIIEAMVLTAMKAAIRTGGSNASSSIGA